MWLPAKGLPCHLVGRKETDKAAANKNLNHEDTIYISIKYQQKAWMDTKLRARTL